jgi:superfamily II DNA helicase RecQ
MHAKVITLHPDPDTGRFDDTELQDFLEDRELLSITEHFYVYDGRPTLLLLLTWRPAPTPRVARPARDEPHADPTADLSGEERPVYEALRRWRNERAKRDGRPAYIYLSNAQLAEITRLRPTTMEALQQIQGIGPGKAGDFGQELLALLDAQPSRVDHAP